MAYPRNPNNLAVEMTVHMATQFLEFVRREFPERLGEGPLPERVQRLGSLPAAPMVQAAVEFIKSQGVNNG